jgi:hypothetical protein
MKFLDTVAQYYVPRGGFNPHATGLVFDLNFSMYHHVRSKDQKALVEAEDRVDAHPVLNEAALRSAVGMWLNTYSMQFNFVPTIRARGSWLRGKDLNLRPLGYEPNELPDCSTPHSYGSVPIPSGQIFTGPTFGNRAGAPR